VAIKLMAGKLFGANDEVLANFELDYGLTLRGAPAAYGKSEVQNDGGKVKITFPKKAPLEQSLVFPFAL
jgi:hypothetical protein